MAPVLEPAPGWLVKLGSDNGDPLARCFKVRISDLDAALERVARTKPDKLAYAERPLSAEEVAEMRIGELCPA